MSLLLLIFPLGGGGHCEVGSSLGGACEALGTDSPAPTPALPPTYWAGYFNSLCLGVLTYSMGRLITQ